jgi:hypothetical protein
MPASWPIALPQIPLIEGYREQPGSQVIRTDMDAGPAKVRRRFTSEVRRFELSLQLTADQMAIFDTFFTELCGGGATPFDWVHPRTGEAGSFRFVSEPTWQANWDDSWSVKFVIERLP